MEFGDDSDPLAADRLFLLVRRTRPVSRVVGRAKRHGARGTHASASAHSGRKGRSGRPTKRGRTNATRVGVPNKHGSRASKTRRRWQRRRTTRRVGGRCLEARARERGSASILFLDKCQGKYSMRTRRLGIHVGFIRAAQGCTLSNKAIREMNQRRRPDENTRLTREHRLRS